MISAPLVLLWSSALPGAEPLAPEKPPVKRGLILYVLPSVESHSLASLGSGSRFKLTS